MESRFALIRVPLMSSQVEGASFPFWGKASSSSALAPELHEKSNHSFFSRVYLFVSEEF